MRTPHLAVPLVVGNRGVVHEACRGVSLVERRREDEWLDRGAGLPLGGEGTVEAPLRVVHPAHRGQDVPGLQVHADERTLELRVHLLHAVAQRLLRLLLQVNVEGGDDVQPPLFHHVCPVTLDELTAYDLEIGQGLSRLDHRCRMRLDGPFLLRGDHLDGDHAGKDGAAPRAHLRQVTQRVVASRVLRHPGKKRAFRLGKLLRVLVEVLPRRLRDSPCTVAEVDLVEVHLEDLVLGVLLLEVHGELDFLYLPVDRLFPGQVLVLDKLLRDGGTAFGEPPLHHVLHKGAGDAAHVDAAVLVEAGVLGGDQRLAQKGRDTVDGDPVALGGEDASDVAILHVEDPDGTVAGGEFRVGRDGGVRGDCKGKRQKKEKENGREELLECCVPTVKQGCYSF